ncbi:hypothetical protein PtA15_8A666 [Puccinia triticina]|uniref:SPX domain-containing protein n=1 Tax=Puccinia triticina TaxID=208348 RepID=A0ABY7CRV4_9BASI|nr:uncharacterized protein PtA15_8A666 [Puccinia triticina]WAQ87760.1 hypothetical protein PtA15_8A666 [Puccinia triticina]WAR57639.1 hypothetical protein PtB15_8B692 [Puccinia triticina]
MDDSSQVGLPPAPPKPSFANRIKIKLEYNDLKSQFYQVTNLKESLFHDLSEKQAKEFKLRMECDLILDQIELIRSRIPIKEGFEPEEETDAELKRLRKYQENTNGFMYESDEGLMQGTGIKRADSASPSSSSEQGTVQRHDFAPHSHYQAEPQNRPDQDPNEEAEDAEGEQDDEEMEDALGEEDHLGSEHDPTDQQASLHPSYSLNPAPPHPSFPDNHAA